MKFTEKAKSLFDLKIGDYIYVNDTICNTMIKTKIINKKYFKVMGDDYISLKFRVYDRSGGYEYDNVRFKVHHYNLRRKYLKYYTLYCDDLLLNKMNKRIDYIYD